LTSFYLLSVCKRSDIMCLYFKSGLHHSQLSTWSANCSLPHNSSFMYGNTDKGPVAPMTIDLAH